MAYGCVYMTINQLNNKKYIGSLIYNRINDWRKYLGSGTELVKDIKKFGKENFYKIILSEHDNEESLRKAEEREIISREAVLSNEYYNIKYAAIGGDTFSNNPHKEKTREKHSRNNAGKLNSQYGKRKKESHIKAIKKANSKPIQINDVIYSSINEASIELGIKPSTIFYRIDSDNFPKYIRLTNKKKAIARKPSNKKRKIKIHGVIYESIAKAGRALGLSYSAITKRLKFDTSYQEIE